jgi:predicted enzyme related to lactoylglutathione lyase
VEDIERRKVASKHTLIAVCLDCSDAGELARFYSELLGWEVTARDGKGWINMRDPAGGVGLNFQTEAWYEPPVWPERPGAQTKMLHFEIQVDDIDAAVERAVAAGATVARPQPPARHARPRWPSFLSVQRLTRAQPRQMDRPSKPSATTRNSSAPLQIGQDSRVSDSQQRLVAVVLTVSDLDRSLAVYRDGFGLHFHAADHEGDDIWTSGRHAATTWTDGAFLHFALYQSKDGTPTTTGAQVAFRVDDLEAAHQRALAGGAELVHAPKEQPWGRSARYRDPDGNIIELTEPA